MTTTLHAHVTTTATDCDGRYDNDYVVVNEYIGEFSDIRFHDRIVSSLVGSYAMGEGHQGTLTVNNVDGTIVLEWNESTDEGYRHASARFCEDDCDESEAGYRDYTAESMGY